MNVVANRLLISAGVGAAAGVVLGGGSALVTDASQRQNTKGIASFYMQAGALAATVAAGVSPTSFAAKSGFGLLGAGIGMYFAVAGVEALTG